MAETSDIVKNRSPPYHLLKNYKWWVAAALLFVAPVQDSNWWMVLVKVQPVICLARLVVSVEAVLRQEVLVLLTALFFSAVGDYYLVYPKECFVQGVLAFWVTQVLYIKSFGFRRVSWRSGAAAYTFLLLCLVLALDFIPSPPEKIVVTFYAFTISTMLWRAIDRAWLDKDLPWERRVYGAAGAAVFCVSDLCIAVLQVGGLLPHLPAQLIILSTYYLAQVWIVLSLNEGFWKHQ